MKTCILGGTGAIGAPIAKRFLEEGFDVQILHSRNFDLFNENLNLGLIEKSDFFIHSSGTFGGLKQYTKSGLSNYETYLNNLTRISHFLEKINIDTIINISSACLGNEINFEKKSNYYEYTILKKEIEQIFSKTKIRKVVNIRPTNIISIFERVNKSQHVIASLYRKISQDNSLRYTIWSNELDWREFTDANDLALYCLSFVKRDPEFLGDHIRKVVYCSNGEKIYIRELVKQLSELIHGKPPVSVIFTQPARPGPLEHLLQEVISPELYKQLPSSFSRSLKTFTNAQITGSITFSR